MKALIYSFLEPEAQGRGKSLILCHALMKIGILYEKAKMSKKFRQQLYPRKFLSLVCGSSTYDWMET